MQYLKPRQRESDKRWDYTAMHDHHVRPIGYCRGWQDMHFKALPTINSIEGFQSDGGIIWSKPDKEDYEARRDKYHTDGHATAQEAADCFRQYCLDTRLNLDGQYVDTQFKCEVCGTWTDRFAEIDHQQHVLCDQHRNREEVEKLFSISADSEIITSFG